MKANHLLLDNFDIVGWDFTIDRCEGPICLEYNVQWPGTVYYQYACGPFAGPLTDDLLAFLKDDVLAENYIPYYMRA